MEQATILSRSQDRVRITLEPVAKSGEHRTAGTSVTSVRMPGQRPATSPMVRPQPQQRVEVTPGFEPARPRTPADIIAAYIERQEFARLPVSVVIATLNDAVTIGHVVSQLEQVEQLIVVDSGSTDDTVEVAVKHRPDAVVVRHQHAGPGSAVIAGIAASSARYVVCVAADDDLDVAEVHRAISMVDSDRGIVAGTRCQVLDEPRGIKPPFGGQGRALAGFCNLLLGTSLADPPFGYVAMSRETAARLGFARSLERAAQAVVPQRVPDPEGDLRRAEARWFRSR